MAVSNTFLRDKLHLYIDVIDEDKVQAIYKLIKEEIESSISSEFTLTEVEWENLDKQRDNYINGRSNHYSWSEVENQLLDLLSK